MKAYLGSCVGVAIIDNKHRIGGMLHILLPEPLCDIPDTQLTYYATTGVPLFIASLVGEGAVREELSAYISGGALIDPSCHQDLSLNIGGRTLEITLRILKDHGIPIKYLEASGTMGFYIMLDVDRSSCTIEPIIKDVSAKKSEAMSMPALPEIGSTIEGLQPVPQVALGIASMIADENSEIASIASEIRKDQVLSAKVLKLCNSSYLGVPRKIESIDQAVAFLGNKTLLQLVITAQAEMMLSGSEKGYSLIRGGLFYHALATARLCERLARIDRGIRPDLAYTAGLLHDIGKVVLDQFMAKVQPLFYRIIQTHGDDSSISEQKIFGIDHTLAGLHLAESWKLPEVIKDVILFHHNPGNAQENTKLVHLVHVADTIAHKFLPGFEIEHIDTTRFDVSLRYLSLTPAMLSDAIGVLTDIF
jgi:putative nucleotidyltransferase with HDIG domain